MSKEHSVLVEYRDSSDLPRAWAVGNNKDATKERALQELDAYIAKRRTLGEPLTREDFRRRVRSVIEL